MVQAIVFFRCLVVYFDDPPVGFARLDLCGDDAHAVSLCIVFDFRGSRGDGYDFRRGLNRCLRHRRRLCRAARNGICRTCGRPLPHDQERVVEAGIARWFFVVVGANVLDAIAGQR